MSLPERNIVVFSAVVLLVSIGLGWWIREEISETTGRAEADADLVACHQAISEFTAYPLLFLGDNFEGLPLNYCARRQDAGTDYGVPASDYFVFVYGDCAVQPERSSCPAPLQVTVFPYCDPPLADGVARTESLRGATAKVLDSHDVFIEEQDYKLLISTGTGGAPGEAIALRAMEQVRGANPLAENLRLDSSLADLALSSPDSAVESPC